MVEILRNALFKDASDESATLFAGRLQHLIKWLPRPKEGTKAERAKSERALKSARSRIDAFVASGSIRDVLAVGDALRYVGEYIEHGGAPQTVEAFRAGLRNAAAFNPSNRARIPVADYVQSERPDLGLFKWMLLQRSVVKYMERFYGSYLGADISGTTTDALAAFAYVMFMLVHPTPDLEQLQDQAKMDIGDGYELVPIAAMVLQYHHSLLECGIALALTSTAMSDSSAIPTYNHLRTQNAGD